METGSFGLDSARGQREARVAPLEISSDIKGMLESASQDFLGNDLLILPPFRRSGISFYGPDDVDAIRLARESGLRAAFLHGADDREYLHEYSASWALEFAIAFAANIGSVGVAGIVGYMISRAKKAAGEGLHEGPAEEVPVRVSVANYRRNAEGKLIMNGMVIEGPSGAAAELLRVLINQDGALGNGSDPASIEARGDSAEKAGDEGVNGH